MPSHHADSPQSISVYVIACTYPINVFVCRMFKFCPLWRHKLSWN
jgi:hypothetical protein